jgi:hypothetical protein
MDILGAQNYLAGLGAVIVKAYSEERPISILTVGNIALYIHKGWLQVGVANDSSFFKAKFPIDGRDDVALDAMVLDWLLNTRRRHPEKEQLLMPLDDLITKKYEELIQQ